MIATKPPAAKDQRELRYLRERYTSRVRASCAIVGRKIASSGTIRTIPVRVQTVLGLLAKRDLLFLSASRGPEPPRRVK